MLAKTIFYLTALAAGAIATHLAEDIIIWTKPGIRFRAVSVTLPPTSTVTEMQTATATATITLRSAPAPFKRSVKRAFLNQWNFQGCVADDEHLPALFSPFPYQLPSNEVTGAACMHFCDERGNTFAATQDGDECWCGDEYGASKVTLIDQFRCNAACAGAPGETCGGKNSLTVYTRAG